MGELVANHTPPIKRASRTADQLQQHFVASPTADQRQRQRLKLPRTPAPVTDDVEDEEYDDVWPARTHTSARRYNNSPQQGVMVRQQPAYQPAQRRNVHPLLYLGIAMLFIVLGVTVSPFISTLWQHWIDNQQYGYPRTYQVWQDVGHGGVSHFIALNNKAVIEVVELPADPANEQPHLYVVATMTGMDAAFIPVTISFLDAKGNGKPDMEVFYNGSVITLFNTGTNFTTKHP